MTIKYHTKLSQKATYLRVYEGERMLYGEEVTDVIKGFEERIAELEKERDECAIVISNLVKSKDVDLSGICSTADKALSIRNLRQQAKGLDDGAKACSISIGGDAVVIGETELNDYAKDLLKQADELEQGE